MDSLPFNIIDAVAIGIIVLSALFAYFRGLVREVLSLTAWGLAAFITWAFRTQSYEFISDFVPIPFIALALAHGGVFIILLILFSALAIPLWSLVGSIGLRPIDRALGVIFGFVRGILLLMVLWIAFTWAVPQADRPKILEASRILPYINDGSKSLVIWIRNLPFPIFQWESSQQWFDTIDEGLGNARPSNDATFQSLNNPQPLAPSRATETAGYDNSERKDLNRLLNTTTQ